MENINRGMHGDSLPMLSPLGLSNRKLPPLGMGYITWKDTNKSNASSDEVAKCDPIFLRG